MKSKFTIKSIEQRWEGSEYFVGSDEYFWIRLDFLLEYYISKNLNLSREFKKNFDNPSIIKKYSEKLFIKFVEHTSDGDDFDYKKYLEWQNMSNPEVKEIIDLYKSF